MTDSRPMTLPLSANDAFKLRYPRYLKGAVLVALALTALAVWLFPQYEPLPYKLRREEMIWVPTPDPPAVADPVEVPPAPVMPRPIEVVDDDDPEGGTIPDLPDFRGPWLPEPQVWQDTGFVTSSAPPTLISRAKPDYPEIARRAGLEGTVLVHVLVGPNGRVRAVDVIQGVHPLLDKAAVAAAMKCRFEPARQREVPVRAWMAMPFRFRLH